VGTAAATITKQAVRNLHVLLPPLTAQQSIAAMLAQYDELIANNTRRVKVLEQLGQAIYEESITRGNLASVLGGKIKQTTVGVSSGKWKSFALTDFVDFVRGIEPGSRSYCRSSSQDSVPFLRVGDLGSRTTGVSIPRELAANTFLHKNDIAITFDGTVGIVATGLEGCYSTGIRRVTVRDNRLTPSVVYFLLKSDRVQRVIREHAKGTTIIHAGSAIDHITFSLPPASFIEAFDDIAAPILQQIRSLRERNLNLRRTRDLLLPKLISGEVSVERLTHAPRRNSHARKSHAS